MEVAAIKVMLGSKEKKLEAVLALLLLGALWGRMPLKEGEMDVSVRSHGCHWFLFNLGQPNF